MANYFEYSICDVTDPEKVGTGTGEDKNGNLRICISLEGIKINPELHPDYNEVNWIALTPECARELYLLLGSLEHLFRGERK